LLVKFFAYIRDYTNCKEIVLPVTETVKDLTSILSEMYGEKLRAKMLKPHAEGSPPELSSEIIIMVNGRHVVHLGGIDTKLKDDDVVQIFPLVAGG